MKKDDFLLTDDSKIIKKHLRQFYDNEAEKYYNTRQKYWKDAEYLLQEIQSTGLKKIKILEFGCGGGRFIKYLHEHFDGEIEYIGIDLSSELLKFAKKDNPNDTFICNDIFKEIINYEQESFDFIVGTSSFQHIPSYKERLFLMKHFYRILNYGGKVLMLNRTYSDRLIKKYKKAVRQAKFKRLLSFGKYSKRDIEIPWKNKKGETTYRFYHFLDKKEYTNLVHYSGFTIKKMEYLDNDGQITPEERTSKSSLFIAEKIPFLQEEK